MSQTADLKELISKNIEELPDKHKKEVLNFLEYLKVKEDQAFIEYVNDRTRQAITAKKHGKKFTTLEELQTSYA